jgi:DNA-binding response OmpR family regulator
MGSIMHRMLVVDGDIETHKQLQLVLTEFHVEAVDRGWLALSELAERPVDVVVMEVHLPDMPGWVLSPQIHRIAADVPVIAVAEDDSWETSHRMRTEGSPLFYYALKPLDMREMAKAVRSAAQWRQRLTQGTS